MPNYCDNNVFLSHKNPDMIDRVEQGFHKNELMGEFYPCPKELHETISGFCGVGTYAQELLEFKQKLNLQWFGHKDWYDWQIDKWGTKWDVGAESGGGDGHISRDSPNDIFVSFLSAWSPPIGFYEHLEVLGFEVKAYYYEMGMGFCGRYHEGVDDYHEIEGNSDWVKLYIPEDIDQEMGISENMWNDEVI